MASSKLQQAVGSVLFSEFPHLKIKENYRPHWLLSSNLTRLELDYYLPELKVGFEIQGRQHYQFVPFFHGTYDNFRLRKQYDQEKRDLCAGRGVTLYEIDALEQFYDVLGAMLEVDTKPDSFVTTKRKIVRTFDRKSAHGKYSRYLSKAAGNLGATMEQKRKEIEQFRKKVRKYNRKPKYKYKIPAFQFQYLSTEEAAAIMEELGVMDRLRASASSY